MAKVSLVYISLSGNTASFIKRLTVFLQERHEGLEVEQINIKDLVKEGQDFFAMDNPFVAFLPTYLEGGNGVDSGDVEILTNDLARFIDFENNYKKCFGIVGSGMVFVKGDDANNGCINCCIALVRLNVKAFKVARSRQGQCNKKHTV